MDFIKKHKNALFALFIVILLWTSEIIQASIYYEYDFQYITQWDKPNFLIKLLDIVSGSLGVLSLHIIIPLIIAIISKFAFKKNFAKVLLICLIFISIPLSLMGSYGRYSIYKKGETPSSSEMQIKDMKIPEQPLPIFKYDSEKTKDLKKLFRSNQVSVALTEQLDILISELFEKLQMSNPNVPVYVFEGMNNKLKSISQAMFWEQNGLMDQLIQIYSENMTHEQIKRLLNFYETPLWKKMNSGKPLSEDEKNILNKLYKNTFDEDIQSCEKIVMKKYNALAKEWSKYALQKVEPEMNEYLKSFGYSLNGYTMTHIR